MGRCGGGWSGQTAPPSELWDAQDPWCYKPNKCVEGPGKGKGNGAADAPQGRPGFQRPSLAAQGLELGETASLKGKHRHLGSLELQHQEEVEEVG